MRTNECSLWAFMLTVGAGLALSTQALAQSDPLPSWNDGAAKSAINEFVRTTTDQASPKFVPLAERIATFDQDGTLWVEHPVYTQVAYCLDRVPAVVKEKPELAQVEPFKTVLSGNREAMAKLSMDDFLKILAATRTGMSVDEFETEAKNWLGTARDARWKRHYTELTYLTMIELLKYLRANAYKTYIVTGGGQDFVRVYSEQVYGIPPEQVVGTADGTSYGYDRNGRPVLTGRCWKIPRPATARGWRCWYRTTTPSVSTDMGLRSGCPTPRLAPSPKPYMTRRRAKVGWSSA